MSYHILETTEKIVCSACNSEHWEGFNRAYGISGMRCLNCGHEKMNEHPFAPRSASSSGLQGYANGYKRETEQKF